MRIQYFLFKFKFFQLNLNPTLSLNMSSSLLNKPLSIFRTGVRDEKTAAAVVSLDTYTIKTIFGDGTVILELLDPQTRKYIPDSLNLDSNEKKISDDYIEEENICTLGSVSDNDIVLEDEKFNLTIKELDELLNSEKWDDLSDVLKKK